MIDAKLHMVLKQEGMFISEKSELRIDRRIDGPALVEVLESTATSRPLNTGQLYRLQMAGLVEEKAGLQS